MKKIAAALVSALPMNLLRIMGYRLMGYRISWRAKIGIGTIFTCRSALIEPHAKVGRMNRFTSNFELIVNSRADIGHFNEFTALPGSKQGRCFIGPRAHITNNHFFDATGGLVIGADTRIAGRGSQFWTHGGQRKNNEIRIGEGCYIGSSVRMAQGVSIAPNTFIGIGSVVVHSCEESGVRLFGNPAVITKRGITARLSLAR